jgi:hypothetical protein
MKIEIPNQGIRLRDGLINTPRAIELMLARFGLNHVAEVAAYSVDEKTVTDVSLRPEISQQWMPDHDTTGLTAHLALDTIQSSNALEKEILITLLASPVVMEFPSIEELEASIHIRRNIVTSGRRTELNFDTAAAERPSSCWTYDEDRGFTVKPGCSLINALKMATQPELSGHLYSFSCYRATEYVILLAIAKELAVCNPHLLDQLQSQCERRVIRSGQFHEVFLHEYGSQESPFPTHYYVPGDRVWFRNPDECSSDIVGFEGSWVLYLGGGLFANFWKHEQPYTLTRKCLEIYHWRHGAQRNTDGNLVMDEDIVERCVEETLKSDIELNQTLMKMMRWRDAKGIYAEGGCIDTTREGPRWVCPGTTNLVLPLQ